MNWSDRRRLAVSIGAATLIPVAALVWLGVRVLQQDREIERQRRRDRLDVAAGRLALDIERRLQDLEDRLAHGEGIGLQPSGLVAGAHSNAVLYQPDVVREPTAPMTGLASAEIQEFQHRDLAAAADSYRNAATADDPTVKAAALVALARVMRQRGDRASALRAYSDLERIGAVAVGGQPAALLALQGRSKVFEESGDGASLRQEVEQLAKVLNAGRWRIDRATFGLYRELLDRWHAPPTPSDAVINTEAALGIWQMWRAGDLPPRGRRVIHTNAGTALTVWADDGTSPRLWVAPTASLDAELAPLWTAQPLRVSGLDADGRRLFGALAGNGALSLMPATTRLPFILSVTPTDDADAGPNRSRRILILGGLVGVLMLILAPAYGLYRSMARELMLARQQSDFVSAVSHEFRTPLTSMRHLTDLLVSRGVATEERRTHYYQLLANETERLHRMVESLLSFGRMEAGAYAFQLEPADPSEIARSVVEEFRAEPSARGREIRCDIADGLPPIRADQETLARALWNLVENAAKYSEAGTPITVFAARHDHAVIIGVGDRGMGIAPDEQSRIFQKFVRGSDAKRAGVRGVGIGLALVKRIVEAHGGSVRVESEPGRGSTFTLVLPCLAS